ncbi:MAG TPA: glutamyl-tRNA reductase [Anaerolineaceae bacterium]|nr:glutamyl-tRNA reductase [Anaerolineaceae bacterium]
MIQLICASLSHHSAPVELRECLSLSEGAIAAAARTIPLRSGRYQLLRELAILSTCNRLEAYALAAFADEELMAAEDPFEPILAYLGEAAGAPIQPAGAYFQRFVGIEAAAHLFRVAAGLDSIAIGETQIQGQVARALEAGLQDGSARHFLSSLFRAAIQAGKRVRTETGLGRRSTSISAVAVQMAAGTVGNLAGRRILVVGAGKMGRLVLEDLRQRGGEDLWLANRTYERAVEVATRVGCSALPFERLPEALADAGLVFLATAAAQPILPAELVARVMAGRSESLALIDLSVPRNVDPDVRRVSGVQVADMDDIQAYARGAFGEIQAEIARAEAIVAEEVSEYEKLLRVVPFIGELHKKVEDIRQREVEKTLHHLSGADPEIEKQIDLLSRSLVRKILHEPTMHLRREADQETLNEYVDALARLFDLSGNDQYLFQ